MSSLEITFLVGIIGLIALLLIVIRNNSVFEFETKRELPRFENPPPPPLKMRKEDFVLRVKTLSDKKDFETNNRVLEIIDRNYYLVFLDLLKFGFSIYPASKAMTEIVELSIRTALSAEEIVSLLPTFQFINGLKCEVVS
jgi:hypothetical protein